MGALGTFGWEWSSAFLRCSMALAWNRDGAELMDDRKF
jgi:hypothetical protein